MRTHITEEVEVTKTETRTVSDTVTCDICGTVYLWRTYGGGVNWVTVNSRYEHDMTAVHHETGTNYPEGGGSTKEAYHVCPECWPKLAAWINSHRGATPTITEHDW